MLTRSLSVPRSLPSPTSTPETTSPRPSSSRTAVSTTAPRMLRRLTAPLPSPSFPISLNRISSPGVIDRPKQLAHQLAAETLLTMAPTSGPESETSPRRADVPAPAVGNAASNRGTPVNDDASDEPRGVKRKSAEDEGRLPSAASLGLVGLTNESKRETNERVFPHSPLASSDLRPLANRPNNNTSMSNNTPGANRYSMYGPTSRESPLTTPWGASGQSRYTPLGTSAARREVSPHVSNPTRPVSPPANRDRFYPAAAAGTLAGYGHYNMGRRELAEHREQLREGKRWLEGMLTKTDKLLQMVETKMALTGEMGGNQRQEELDYEERDRARLREIHRLEAEREKDRAERLKRDRERELLQPVPNHYERERPRLPAPHVGQSTTHSPNMTQASNPLSNSTPNSSNPHPNQTSNVSNPTPNSASGLNPGSNQSQSQNGGREKSEAERNRDLLLASRRVTAVSPNPQHTRTHSHTPPQPPTQKSNWDGEPVMGGTALPRRDQGRGLGRGLWGFDVRS
ncbi:hypothetical protein M231_03571 [Tremella mesenterica]|uniref:Uncharacterized protein n=1 Tax=Tremella mesenterica TaxID=5217 RepID=A0A4Q1BMZ0_TREME|nr:hypothetical protein M231_03571 [Tremella mesenterica]